MANLLVVGIEGDLGGAKAKLEVEVVLIGDCKGDSVEGELRLGTTIKLGVELESGKVEESTEGPKGCERGGNGGLGILSLGGNLRGLRLVLLPRWFCGSAMEGGGFGFLGQAVDACMIELQKEQWVGFQS